MPKKGYKQTEEHKRKVRENSLAFIGRKCLFVEEQEKEKICEVYK